jgi:serine/threonine protein kinase
MSHSLDATTLLSLNSYGTVTHMAPEVLLQGVSSNAADVYSFGELMWQMLTSSRPWAGLRHDMVVRAVAQERRALQLPASCPAALAGPSTACMAWDSGQRPGMQSVVQQLQQLAAQYNAESLLEDF